MTNDKRMMKFNWRKGPRAKRVFRLRHSGFVGPHSLKPALMLIPLKCVDDPVTQQRVAGEAKLFSDSRRVASPARGPQLKIFFAAQNAGFSGQSGKYFLRQTNWPEC